MSCRVPTRRLERVKGIEPVSQAWKAKTKAKAGELTTKEKKELTEEEKEYKSKRKLVQEKLIKFATRIPAFMYPTERMNEAIFAFPRYEGGLTRYGLYDTVVARDESRR